MGKRSIVLRGVDGVTGSPGPGPSCVEVNYTNRAYAHIQMRCYALCKSILLCVIRKLVLFTLNHRLAIDLGRRL